MMAGALVAVLLFPLALSYRFARDEVGLARSVLEIQHYVATPASYLAATAENRWLGEVTARFRTREAVLFPGLVTLVLAGAGVLLAWRAPTGWPRPDPAVGGRWPRALDVVLAAGHRADRRQLAPRRRVLSPLGPGRDCPSGTSPSLSSRSRSCWRCDASSRAGPRPIRGLAWLGRLGWPNAAGLYVALTAVGVIASFGPEVELGETLRLRPLYAQLYLLVPGFDALRVPGRFGILVTTGLAVLAGFGAAALARRLRRPRWRTVALGALGGVAVLEAWTVPLALVSVSPDPGPADAWLAAQPGADAVVVLPMYERRAAHLESLRLVASTAHWRPLVNGYAGIFPARLRGGRHHAQHLPGPGRRRAAPDDVRPLRGACSSASTSAEDRARITAGARASSPGRRASRRLRGRPDLRDRRPKGRARQATRVVRTKARARSSTAGSARPADSSASKQAEIVSTAWSR